MYIGKDNWVLRGPIEEEEELNSLLKSGAALSDVSVVLVSDTLTFFSVSGAGAKDIMAIASPLDFYETKFRENSVTFSEVFGIKALIKRVENGFEFGVDQSYGDMVEDYLSKSIKL